MIFYQKENSLIWKNENELVVIEAWGNNALRVRATMYPKLNNENWALEYIKPKDVRVFIENDKAIIINGKIKAEISNIGKITFFKDGEIILNEYYRAFGFTKHSPSMRFKAREFKPINGGDYILTIRFESNEDEKIYGMGQYQQPNFDLKGCILELAQRNSQISVPFAMSNLGYGFLWNNPAIGKVMFGANYTEWEAEVMILLER